MLGFGSLGEAALGESPGNSAYLKTVSISVTGAAAASRIVGKFASMVATGVVTQGAKDVAWARAIAVSGAVTMLKAVMFLVALISVTAGVTIATPRDVLQAVNIAVSNAVTTFKEVFFSVSRSVTGAATQGAKSIEHAHAFSVSAAVTTLKAVTFLVSLISANVSAQVLKNVAHTQSLISVSNVVTKFKDVSKIATIPVICTITDFLAMLRVTSRRILQDVVDCVLAGQMPLDEKTTEWEIPPSRTTERSVMNRSGGTRRAGPAPSFTTKVSNKGYD